MRWFASLFLAAVCIVQHTDGFRGIDVMQLNHPPIEASATPGQSASQQSDPTADATPIQPPSVAPSEPVQATHIEETHVAPAGSPTIGLVATPEPSPMPPSNADVPDGTADAQPTALHSTIEMHGDAPQASSEEHPLANEQHNSQTPDANAVTGHEVEEHVEQVSDGGAHGRDDAHQQFEHVVGDDTAVLQADDHEHSLDQHEFAEEEAGDMTADVESHAHDEHGSDSNDEHEHDAHHGHDLHDGHDEYEPEYSGNNPTVPDSSSTPIEPGSTNVDDHANPNVTEIAIDAEAVMSPQDADGKASSHQNTRQDYVIAPAQGDIVSIFVVYPSLEVDWRAHPHGDEYVKHNLQSTLDLLLWQMRFKLYALLQHSEHYIQDNWPHLHRKIIKNAVDMKIAFASVSAWISPLFDRCLNAVSGFLAEIPDVVVEDSIFAIVILAVFLAFTALVRIVWSFVASVLCLLTCGVCCRRKNAHAALEQPSSATQHTAKPVDKVEGELPMTPSRRQPPGNAVKLVAIEGTIDTSKLTLQLQKLGALPAVINNKPMQEPTSSTTTAAPTHPAFKHPGIPEPAAPTHPAFKHSTTPVLDGGLPSSPTHDMHKHPPMSGNPPAPPMFKPVDASMHKMHQKPAVDLASLPTHLPEDDRNLQVVEDSTNTTAPAKAFAHSRQYQTDSRNPAARPRGSSSLSSASLAQPPRPAFSTNRTYGLDSRGNPTSRPNAAALHPPLDASPPNQPVWAQPPVASLSATSSVSAAEDYTPHVTNNYADSNAAPPIAAETHHHHEMPYAHQYPSTTTDGYPAADFNTADTTFSEHQPTEQLFPDDANSNQHMFAQGYPADTGEYHHHHQQQQHYPSEYSSDVYAAPAVDENNTVTYSEYAAQPGGGEYAPQLVGEAGEYSADYTHHQQGGAEYAPQAAGEYSADYTHHQQGGAEYAPQLVGEAGEYSADYSMVYGQAEGQGYANYPGEAGAYDPSQTAYVDASQYAYNNAEQYAHSYPEYDAQQAGAYPHAEHVYYAGADQQQTLDPTA